MKKTLLFRTLVFVLSAAMMMSFLAGCATKPAAGAASSGDTANAAPATSADDEIVIGVPVYTMEHPFYIELMAAVEARCKELGVKLIYDDSNYDAVKQISIMENMITQGVDAMIVAAVDPKGIVPTVQKAQEQGVKIIVEANLLYDKDENALGETFVGIDNYAAAMLGGEAAGKKFAAEYAGKDAKIAIISYPVEQACIDREKGFVDGFKKYVPNAVVVASQNGEAVRDKSMSIMENILTANPDVNVVFGINDDSALGALAALEARGITSGVIVVGFDGTDDAKAAIKEGGIYFGDVVQDATKIGTECVNSAVAAAKGEKLPPVTAIDASFITISDIK